MTEYPGNEREIAAREKAATGGPWESRLQCYGDGTAYKIQGAGWDIAVIAKAVFRPEQEACGDFIAHAREDIPYLLAQLKDRDEKLANWEPWMSALGRMLTEYRIARFPDDVLAWREKLAAVEKAAIEHDYQHARQFMDAVDRILYPKGE